MLAGNAKLYLHLEELKQLAGNFKIHTFTGPGTFTVTASGSSAPGSGTGDSLVDI